MSVKNENKFFLVLLFIALILLSINSSGQKNILRLKNVFAFVYQESFRVVEGISYKLKNYVVSHKIHRNTFKKNQKLIKEITNLRNENIYLKSMLLSKNIDLENISSSFATARIISWDLKNPYNTFTINKGSKNNIKKDCPVLDEKGKLVGKIIEPISYSTSTVLLASSTEFGSGVEIGKNEVLGILEGKGKKLAEIKYIRMTEKINPGDIVQTSGLDKIFPKGIIIGKIKSIDKTYYYQRAISTLDFLENNTRFVGVFLK